MGQQHVRLDWAQCTMPDPHGAALIHVNDGREGFFDADQQAGRQVRRCSHDDIGEPPWTTTVAHFASA
jgi:hypothetical protein